VDGPVEVEVAKQHVGDGEQVSALISRAINDHLPSDLEDGDLSSLNQSVLVANSGVLEAALGQ
jgi:hypothetical protein